MWIVACAPLCRSKGFSDRQQELLNLMVADRNNPRQADMIRGLNQGIL